MPVGDSVVEAILDLVRSARPEEATASNKVKEMISWGPGPRAAQALMLACRARALIKGNLAPSIEDVAALAHPVMVHRMALGFGARAQGVSLSGLISELTVAATGIEAAA